MEWDGEAFVVSEIPAGIGRTARQVAVAGKISGIDTAVLRDVYQMYPAVGRGVS